jgi:hypothetical protein
MCMLCRLLFVLLYFFLWPLCCLIFDLRGLWLLLWYHQALLLRQLCNDFNNFELSLWHTNFNKNVDIEFSAPDSSSKSSRSVLSSLSSSDSCCPFTFWPCRSLASYSCRSYVRLTFLLLQLLNAPQLSLFVFLMILQQILYSLMFPHLHYPV